MEDYIAALVTDQVFVKWRKQDTASFLESARSGVVSEVEFPAVPFLCM